MVVPVHGVEDYLVQCLDSLRASGSASVEIIAVDDASPDSCGDILDRYAGIKVIHLDGNVGLGLARNAGLAQATGDYVWFVDSDDWVPPGSIKAVLDELAASEPDVLLIDHLRAYDDGRREVDASSHLLAGPVTLDRVLGVQHTAWNRIVRRSLLLGHDLQFRPGWYEDVPFSLPVLLAASRIAVLNRVCYYYRIGRAGAITATRSDRHFEAFTQYDRLQEWLAGHHVAPEVRARLFHLMINHLLVVAGNDGRMHPSRRRAFFRQLAASYRRYRPAGYRPGLRHRLVAAGNYPLYSLLRAAYRARAPRSAAPAMAARSSAPTVATIV
ncbi:glycosyltransferase [Actinoplanes sp. TBRC 11911]|nr:glycosyltransferase [Actinoplanes sp. TBRC 11911]